MIIYGRGKHIVELMRISMLSIKGSSRPAWMHCAVACVNNLLTGTPKYTHESTDANQKLMSH
jgi:hypothetical protein